MSSFPWLTVLGLVPLVGAAVVVLLPGGMANKTREIALGFSVVTFALAVAMAFQFKNGAPEQFQLVEQHSWIPQFGVSYALGIDGIALVLILMSVVLVPVCLLAAWHDEPGAGRRQQTYFALMLVLETFIIGVFSATDVFFFYIFFEGMLIPIYFLIGSFGGAQRQYAALKFLLYSLIGGLILLVAVIALYLQGPGGTDGFLIERLTGLHMDPTTERLLFLGFFAAFAIKAPMFPVHTWLPDAATEGRPATTVLLVGILDKVGTFGMIRFCLQLFPDASKWATPVVIVLAVVSVLYGALLAIGQTDMMRLIAYTSISHFGFIVLGIFAMTTVGGAGSALYMVNHGITTAALFLVIGMLIQRRGSKFIPDYGGWQRVTPIIAGVFLLSGMSALALPGLNSFVSEFLVLIGTFQRYPAAAVIATLGIILASLYILLMYQKVFTGPTPDFGADAHPGTGSRAEDGSLATDGLADADRSVGHDWVGDDSVGAGSLRTKPRTARRAAEHPTKILDMSGREKWVVAPLIVLMLGLGFYPKPVLDAIRPAVNTTLQYVGVTDPAPILGGVVDGSTK